MARPLTDDELADILGGDTAQPAAPVQTFESVREEAAQQDPEGFLMRAKAGLKKTPEGVIGLLQHEYPDAEILPEKDPDSGALTGNLAILEPGKPPRVLRDPGGMGFELADIADVSGDIGSGVIGTIGTAVGSKLGAGAGAVGGPKGALIGAVAGGALFSGAGDLAHQYVSEQLPGDDNLDTRERLESAGTAALFGGAGELGGAAVAKAVPAVGGALLQGARRLTGAAGGKGAAEKAAATALAGKIASEAGEASAIGVAKNPVRSFYEESLQLGKEISKETGEDFALSLGEATGSKVALTAQRAVARAPATSSAAFRAQQAKLSTIGRYSDKIIERFAANPDDLGNANVGARLVGAVKAYTDELDSQRRAVSKPLYDAAKDAFGDTRIPAEGVIGALSDLAEEKSLGPAGAEVAKRLADVKKLAEGGGLTFAQMRNLRRMYSKGAASRGSVFKDMAEAEEREVSRRLLSAVTGDLDEASKGAGQGADLLRQANAQYAKYSRAIEQTSGRPFVKKLLNLAADDADETIIDRIMTGKKKQIAGLFKILEKQDKATAQDLRSQVLRNVLKKGGKAAADTEFGKEVVAAGIDAGFTPKRLANAIGQHQDLLGTVYAGDRKALSRVMILKKVLDRISQGPGIEGSSTSSNLVHDALAQNVRGGPGEVFKRLKSATAEAVSQRVFSGEAMQKILFEPEGLDLMAKTLPGLLSKGPMKPRRARALTKSLGRIIALANRPAPETEEEGTTP